MQFTTVTKVGLRLPITPQVLAVGAPAASVSLPAAQLIAHGRIPDNGVVMVDCEAAAVLTLYVYVPIRNKWRYPGTDSGAYQKTFTTDGELDFFEGPTGALFYIATSTGTPTIYHSGDPVLQ